MSKKSIDYRRKPGQDGSYLAELLLEKGAMRYTAWCAVLPQRRESVSTI